MLKSKIIKKLTTNADLLVINDSRCLRMRFDDNENKCSRCADCCPVGAISIEELDINREACTECMLCAAACPSGGVEISQFNFYSVISKLRKVPQPVLGCSIKENLKAHVSVFCLGLLSEEHLIALMVFLNAPLQINLTECSSCKNSMIVDVLKKRLETINSKFKIQNSKSTPLPLAPCPLPLTDITLVEDKASLQYQDIDCDRRGFFNVLKKLTMEGAHNFIQSTAEPKDKSAFSEQVLPFRKMLLNRALSTVMEREKGGAQEGVKCNENVIPAKAGIQKEEGLDSRSTDCGNDAQCRLTRNILDNYYYDIRVDENCDMCTACVAMCPTGALEESADEADDSLRELLFSAALCFGCGLCADFCEQKSIKIRKGFSGEDPFKKICIKKDRE